MCARVDVEGPLEHPFPIGNVLPTSRPPPADADDDIEGYGAHDNSSPLTVQCMFLLYSSIGRRGKISPCTTRFSHHLDPHKLFDGSIVFVSNGRLPELSPRLYYCRRPRATKDAVLGRDHLT
jgi:hypothetical protein